MDAFKNIDEKYMNEAIEEAQRSFDAGDVPVGAVIVDKDGEIIARAYNEREKNADATAHAELLCIERACKKKGGWRLSDCTIYVTLEPCPMCAGALINSRIKRVVCGTKNPKFGSFGSVINMNSANFNHKCVVEFGVSENKCRGLLSEFFSNKRSHED